MNKADRIFKDVVREVIDNGMSTEGYDVRPVYIDGKAAHTKFITHVSETYDISKGEFPIITVRQIPWKSGIKEILWIYQDQTSDLKVLRDKYGITWWDEWNIGNDTIGQRYGATVKKYDMMNKLLKGLQNQPYGRRHIIDLYQFSDFEESEGLYPCAFQTLWSARGEYLDMTLIQRSSDYLVANHINKMQYVALQMMVARHVGLQPGKFTHYVENLHIYDRHLDQAQILLERTPSDKGPKLILKPNKSNFYDFSLEDFQMVEYEPVKPNVKFELGI